MLSDSRAIHLAQQVSVRRRVWWLLLAFAMLGAAAPASSAESRAAMMWYKPNQVDPLDAAPMATWRTDLLELNALGVKYVLVLANGVPEDPSQANPPAWIMSFRQTVETLIAESPNTFGLRVLWRVMPDLGQRKNMCPANLAMRQRMAHAFQNNAAFLRTLADSPATAAFQAVTGEPPTYFNLDDTSRREHDNRKALDPAYDGWWDYESDYMNRTGLPIVNPRARTAQDTYWFAWWRTQHTFETLAAWTDTLASLTTPHPVLVPANPTNLLSRSETNHLFDLPRIGSHGQVACIANMQYDDLELTPPDERSLAGLETFRLAFTADGVKDLMGLPVMGSVQAHLPGGSIIPPTPSQISQYYRSIWNYASMPGLYPWDMHVSPNAFIKYRTADNAPARWQTVKDLFAEVRTVPVYQETEDVALILPLAIHQAARRRYLVMAWALWKATGHDVHLYDPSQVVAQGLHEPVAMLVYSPQYPQALLTALDAWVRGGGTLVLDPESRDVVTEDGVASPVLKSIIGLKTGRAFPVCAAAPSADTLVPFTLTASHPFISQFQLGDTLAGEWLRCGYTADDFEPSVTVLGTSGAEPVLTVHPHGQGSGIYLSTYPSFDNGQNLIAKLYDNFLTPGQSSNQPPVFAPIGNTTVDEGQLVTFQLLANDPEGDPLTYGTAEPLPAGANLDPTTGLFGWTPGYSQAGAYAIDFTVTDGNVTTIEPATISVMDVNRLPVLAPLGDRAITEGQLLQFMVSATDPDGDPLNFSASGLPAGASFSGQVFSWTPSDTQAGSYRVIFSVSDGSLSDSETINITVADVVVDVTPPTVRFTYPTGSPVPKNTTITLQASATDNIGVSRLQFLVNGVLLCTDTATPYSCRWASPRGSGKTSTLKAVAADPAGNSGSTTLTVTTR